MPFNNKNILVIDDTPSIRAFLRISLEAHGASVFEAGTAGEGLEISGRVKPDLIVLDLGLPDQDGLEILPQLKQQSDARDGDHSTTKIVVLSVRNEQRTIAEALRLRADAYVTKPFLMENLLEVLERQLSKPLH